MLKFIVKHTSSHTPFTLHAHNEHTHIHTQLIDNSELIVNNANTQRLHKAHNHTNNDTEHTAHGWNAYLNHVLSHFLRTIYGVRQAGRQADKQAMLEIVAATPHIPIYLYV